MIGVEVTLIVREGCGDSEEHASSTVSHTTRHSTKVASVPVAVLWPKRASKLRATGDTVTISMPMVTVKEVGAHIVMKCIVTISSFVMCQVLSVRVNHRVIVWSWCGWSYGYI